MGTLIGIAIGVVAVLYILPRVAPMLASAGAGGGVSSILGSLKSGVATLAQTPQETAAVSSISSSAQAIAQGAPIATGAAQAQATGSILQATTAAASAIPIVGSTLETAISGLGKIVASLFKGADPTQVASAEIQQAYDILGLNLCTLGGAVTDPVTHITQSWGPKMLPQQLLIDAMEAVMQGCQQAELYAEQTGKVDVSVYRRSLSNIQADMQSYINAVQSGQGYAAECTLPVGLSAARALYFSTLLPSSLIGPGHWYAWSVTQGQALTDQFVQLLPQGVILS